MARPCESVAVADMTSHCRMFWPRCSLVLMLLVARSRHFGVFVGRTRGKVVRSFDLAGKRKVLSLERHGPPVALACECRSFSMIQEAKA